MPTRLPARLGPLAFLIAAAVALSCGDGPTEPGGNGRLAPGDSVTGTLQGAGDSLVRSVVVDDTLAMALTCRASGGGVRAWLVPDSGWAPVLLCTAAAGAPTATGQPTHVAPGRYDLVVTRFGDASAPATFVVRLDSYKRTPETRGVRASVHDTIAEVSAGRLDVDSFAVRVTAGETYVVYLQPTEPEPDGFWETLSVYAGPGCGVPEGVTSGTGTLLEARSGATDLQEYYSRRLIALADGDCPLVVGAQHRDSYAGPYRLQLRRVSRGFEGGGVVAPGDTVQESLDYAGDVDEVEIRGTPGDRYAAYLQAVGDSTRLVLSLATGASNEVYAPLTLDDVGVSGAERLPLLARSTGSVAVPASGRLVLRVAQNSTSPGGGGSRGPYRVFLYKVNPAPESRPAVIALGDSVPSEQLDLAQDVDEFRFTVATRTLASIALDAPLVNGMEQVVLEGAGPSPFSSTFRWTNPGAMPGYQSTTGVLTLEPGEYVVRARHYADRAPGARAPYRIWTAVVNPLPERAAPTLAVGDTARDAIDVLGDRDRYEFAITSGRPFTLSLASDLEADGTQRVGWAKDETATVTEYLMFENTDPTAPVARTTGRVEVARTGTAALYVQGGRYWREGIRPGDRGPYRLVLDTVRTAPESRPSAIALGDSVVEAVDRVGDVDDFVLSAPPGSEIAVNVLPTAATESFEIVVTDDATGASVDTAVASPRSRGAHVIIPEGLRYSERMRVPASGRLRLRAGMPASSSRTQSQGSGNPWALGGYAFRVLPVNRAPERVPASFALGDTVSGEDLAFPVEVDEFTFTATAGQRLGLWANMPVIAAGEWAVQFDLLSPSGEWLTSGGSLGTVASATLMFETSTQVLTETGTYRVRVHGDSYPARGYYRFLVRALP